MTVTVAFMFACLLLWKWARPFFGMCVGCRNVNRPRISGRDSKQDRVHDHLGNISDSMMIPVGDGNSCCSVYVRKRLSRSI
ncbi:hypothetical protein NJLHNGOC_05415 [Novacetimonas cocois]|uniref:Uncharacterized protein n=1 Tax=Novacetimonas cocois TaxID=1747507 RepID=A0A365YX89_9PROT|nr:hypothetical protein NJLHNGOC_05415 [Novacetimonas cocois]